MILHSLADYYVRKCADPDPNQRLAPPGFVNKAIPFIIELDRNGNAIQIEATGDTKGKKRIPQSFLVPEPVKRSSGIEANLLWDNAEYVLGIVSKGKLERVTEQHHAFVQKIHNALGDINDEGVRVVLAFLSNLPKSQLTALQKFPVWAEIKDTNPNITFRLQGDVDLVCQRPSVIAALSSGELSEDNKGICLISGEQDQIERLHPAIQGVWGAQASGGNIVSFNLGAFNSYGKEQGANAPIGKKAAAQYTKALNYLLSRNSKQRLQIGDASTVFWAQRPTSFEAAIVDIFGEPTRDDPKRNVNAVKTLLNSSKTGNFYETDINTRFYVLGLSPNNARIAIRFWHATTIGELANNIRRHFIDLRLDRPEDEKEYLSLGRLLRSLTPSTGKKPFGDDEKLPPNLAGEVMRAILSGSRYPDTLLQAAVRRIRAEPGASVKLLYYRTSLLKAFLNRINEKELAVSLDVNNTDQSYLLGRLFFMLEQTQWFAHSKKNQPGINATIRDRFYGAASSTPASTFPTLLRLYKHHISKIKSDRAGIANNLEGVVGEIFNGLPAKSSFPAHLTIQQQGEFAVGYYHQRHNYFNAKKA